MPAIDGSDAVRSPLLNAQPGLSSPIVDQCVPCVAAESEAEVRVATRERATILSLR
jgi:hypothetical protein